MRTFIFLLCAASAWSQQGQFIYGSQLNLTSAASGPSLVNMLFWYKPNIGKINPSGTDISSNNLTYAFAWVDQSGNNYGITNANSASLGGFTAFGITNLVQTNLNGWPVAYWPPGSGSGNQCIYSNGASVDNTSHRVGTGSNSYTFYLVIDRLGEGAGGNNASLFFGGNYNDSTLYANTATADAEGYNITGGSQYEYQNAGNGIAQSGSSPAFVNNVWYTLVFTFDTVANQSVVRSNGVPIATLSSGTFKANFTNFIWGCAGYHSGGIGDGPNMYTAEMIGYTGNHFGTATLTNNEQYLRTKYAHY